MKPRVAMLAYACDPTGSGEHWLGWGWAEEAARSHDVHLFTTTRSRENVERWAAAIGVTTHFVEMPPGIRRISECFGQVGSWLRKIVWARAAARNARRLHTATPFALVHQTTFHTFRVPFFAASLGIPSVWGPLAGGEHTPPGFEMWLGNSTRSESNRARMNAMWLRWPAVQRSLRRASAILPSNQTTLRFLPEECHARCEIMPPNALRVEDSRTPAPRRAPDGGRFQMLYVGNCVDTRCLPLVFSALDQPDAAGIDLIIVGQGPALEGWKKMVTTRGLDSRVYFAGQVSRGDLPAFYNRADALVFPALRDSGGSALLEAMSKAIPVVCLDWAGPAEMLDDSCGIKVPVTSPAAAVEGLARAFRTLSEQPELAFAMGRRGAERANAHFTWEAKRERLEAIYARLLAKQP